MNNSQVSLPVAVFGVILVAIAVWFGGQFVWSANLDRANLAKTQTALAEAKEQLVKCQSYFPGYRPGHPIGSAPGAVPYGATQIEPTPAK